MNSWSIRSSFVAEQTYLHVNLVIGYSSRAKYLYTVVIFENEVVVKTQDLESVGGTYLF